MMALSIGVAFKVETLNVFKVLGCGLAILGVGLSVYDGLALGIAGADALTGDLIMIAAVTVAASFTVFSKRYFQKYGSWAVSYLAICAGFFSAVAGHQTSDRFWRGASVDVLRIDPVVFAGHFRGAHSVWIVFVEP